MIGWIIGAAILGAITVAAVVTFWEHIRNWLNTTAADAVEKVLGYEARKKMHLAISVADKAVRRVKGERVLNNVSTVFTHLDSGKYNKTVMHCWATEDEFNDEVLTEFKNGKNVIEMKYENPL